eukprot:1162023-Pelagomonas_calceolata.AAC.2
MEYSCRSPLEQSEHCLARNLARDILEVEWFIKNVSNNPILNAWHAVMPGIRKGEKFPLDGKQIANVPHKSTTE